MSHNQFPKFLELGSLEWFGKKVSNHFGCWAVLNCQVAFLNLVGQEEVTNVNGTSSLTRTSLTISFEKNCGLVVLVQDVLLDFVTLGLHKKFSPGDVWRKIM